LDKSLTFLRFLETQCSTASSNIKRIDLYCPSLDDEKDPYNFLTGHILISLRSLCTLSRALDA
jgi:hypothetical protein